MNKQEKICLETAKKWVPSDCIKECNLCQVEFGMLRWKYHCRACGNVFCSNCTQNNEYVCGFADQKVKVCDLCHRDIIKSKKVRY